VIIPLAVVLVWFGLSQGLRPLTRLRDRIEARREADLSPIALRRVPEELRPLTEAFNSMLARMQHNVTAQRRFIADAAHQMRTPLTGLKTQAQLAMRETDPAELRHALRQILNGADRASHLVDQLLALARAEASEHSQQTLVALDLITCYGRSWKPGLCRRSKNASIWVMSLRVAYSSWAMPFCCAR
jgi:two-component system sensor histidine kinase TctE